MEKTMLALRLGKDSDGVHTAYGEAMGTPTYMPPEQAEGKLDIVNERSDVYSLGAVLYEILTGQVPFKGKDVYTILKKVLQDEPASIQSIAPDAPPELAAICKRAMSKDVNNVTPMPRNWRKRSNDSCPAHWCRGIAMGYANCSVRFVRKHKAIFATAAAAMILAACGRCGVLCANHAGTRSCH
jgi:eukaryotic-like serine/threonine-protein kinase